jgi:fatty acid desaturase
MIVSKVFAETTQFEQNITKITYNISDVILTPIIWLLIGASMIMFFWGLAHFIASTDDAVKKDGKEHMVWGVAGLFIVFSVWGLLNLLSGFVSVLGQA